MRLRGSYCLRSFRTSFDMEQCVRVDADVLSFLLFLDLVFDGIHQVLEFIVSRLGIEIWHSYTCAIIKVIFNK